MNKTLLEIPKELQNHYKKQVSDQLFKLKFYEEVPKSHPYRFASMDAQSLDMLEQIMVDALCIYDVFHTDFGIKTDIVKAFALFAAFRNAGFQPEITSDKTEDLFRINLSDRFTILSLLPFPFFTCRVLPSMSKSSTLTLIASPTLKPEPYIISIRSLC